MRYAVHYGDFSALSAAQLDWFAVPVLSGVLSCTVQCYYAHRIHVLSRSWPLTMVISLACIIGNFSELRSNALASAIIWHAGSAACDLIIAASATFLFQRFDTEFAVARVKITRVINLIVQTGILTAFIATLDLVLFAAYPHRAYYACVALTITKLYSTTLLVSLNSRVRIVGGRMGSLHITDAVEHSWASARRAEVATRRTASAGVGPITSLSQVEELQLRAYSEHGISQLVSVRLFGIDDEAEWL
ncbi:uncharacterized protein PHACADRAFT_140960 [Phanerochaete carnosa HHB-10118-sp]|uniref:DUF6534 domain-containing protein n=1 Tax=Phanerochaete carnosa (strain HHB-10118-sp) TaxID=650164 RepID=K5V1H4_PHACS|nr:uncharacterized protein PHACADRAFT_140960 [Phanerochaete carnosa HHB-10118-sp]EKM56326.1 hypothetical protein PHACADRAFT_140960 [Phanerochaete carnosa HHB-10118-sp]